MSIEADLPFLLKDKVYLDSRCKFKSISEMKNFPENWLPDGLICWNEEDGKRYEFLSTHTEEPILGKWKEYKGGGGLTPEQEEEIAKIPNIIDTIRLLHPDFSGYLNAYDHDNERMIDANDKYMLMRKEPQENITGEDKSNEEVK